MSLLTRSHLISSDFFDSESVFRKNVHEFVIHDNLEKKQVEDMEQKLKAIGFRVGSHKDGSDFSGHSIGGKYQNVDLWIRLVYRESSGGISAELEAVASPEEEKAARSLIDYLGFSTDELDGQPPPGN